MIELVLPIIKYVLAPLEVGPEFAPNQEVRLTWSNRRLPSPPQINSSVSLSSDITFNYSAENLLIPTIKATIETSWY